MQKPERSIAPRERLKAFTEEKLVISHGKVFQTLITRSETRSSADADNRLDAFSGQSRSTNMVPFHMFHDLEMGVKGHSRSLRVISFDRLCMVSY